MFYQCIKKCPVLTGFLPVLTGFLPVLTTFFVLLTTKKRRLTLITIVSKVEPCHKSSFFCELLEIRPFRFSVKPSRVLARLTLGLALDHV